MNTTGRLCTVCGRPASPQLVLDECGECGGAFHLNLRTDVEARGCGAAFVSNACGMTTLCDPCAERLATAAMAQGGPRLVRVP